MIVDGVVPPNGLTVIHGVMVVAVNAPGVTAEIAMVCAGGVVPAWTEKLSWPGFNVNTCPDPTVRLTAMVCAVPLAGVMLMDPLYFPAAMAMGLTETESVPGVLLPEAATNNQGVFPALYVNC